MLEVILGLGNSIYKDPVVASLFPQLVPYPFLLPQRSLTATELLGLTKLQNFPWLDRLPGSQGPLPWDEVPRFQEGETLPL